MIVTNMYCQMWTRPLEKGMAIHSSILAWRTPWTEEAVKTAAVHGVTKSQIRLADNTHARTRQCEGF